jgi:putative membrane protein
MKTLNAVGREFQPVESRSPWKGLASGAMGGLAATVVMTQFQNAVNSIARPGKKTESKDKPAPVKTAEKISEKVFGHELKNKEQKTAGRMVHYSFGTAVGALYGVATEMNWRFPRAAGLPYGTAVWLGGDELAVPALGLAKGGRQVPLSMHTYALSSHLVYGAALELFRRGFRKLL